LSFKLEYKWVLDFYPKCQFGSSMYLKKFSDCFYKVASFFKKKLKKKIILGETQNWVMIESLKSLLLIPKIQDFVDLF